MFSHYQLCKRHTSPVDSRSERKLPKNPAKLFLAAAISLASPRYISFWNSQFNVSLQTDLVEKTDNISTMAEQNRQWQTRQDGLDKVFQTSAPIPNAGEGEVLVRIKTVSLNYRDTEGKFSFPRLPLCRVSHVRANTGHTYIVSMGLYNHHKTVDGDSSQPLVLCSDMCGEIVSTGPGVSTCKPGDRVMGVFCQMHQTGQIKAHYMASGLGLPLDGVLQDYRVFWETGLVRVPDHLSDKEACCLPVAAVTAWMAINGSRPLGQAGGKGEVVLLQGTGGVSISGLQIAKASGATSEFLSPICLLVCKKGTDGHET